MLCVLLCCACIGSVYVLCCVCDAFVLFWGVLFCVCVGAALCLCWVLCVVFVMCL